MAFCVRGVLAVFAFSLMAGCDADVQRQGAEEPGLSSPIPPRYPIPTVQQLEWHRMEQNLFIHWGINTFTGQDWPWGPQAPVETFAPRGFHPEQWARVARETGFKGIIFTTKHHDGFTLFPSWGNYEYSIANASWRGGQADLVREVADAVRNEGLKVGWYLSAWDKTHDSHAPAYDAYLKNQIYQLTSEYGPLFEFWIDLGWGEDRPAPEWDIRGWTNIVRYEQPGAIMLWKDVHYVGNEEGMAPEENWSIVWDWGREGVWGGLECDVPNRRDDLRRSWFWHPGERPRSLEWHIDNYFTTVGRNCTLLLNVPPNRSGVLDSLDVALLYEYRQALDEIFRTDLLADGRATASNVRSRASGWAAGQALVDSDDTFWATDDSVTAATLEVTLGRRQTFNVIELAEPIRYGQRVSRFRVEAYEAGTWRTVARGTTIGYKRLLRPGRVTASKVRLVIEDSRGAPAISRFALFESDLVPAPLARPHGKSGGVRGFRRAVPVEEVARHQ